MAHEDIHVHVTNQLPPPIEITLTEDPDIVINATVSTNVETVNITLVEEDPVIINVDINNTTNTPIDIVVFDPLFSLDQSFHINGDLTVEGTINTSQLFVDSIEIDPSGALVNQVLLFDGTKFIPSTVTGGGGGGGGGGGTPITVRYTQVVPAGSSSVVITHNLGSTDIFVEVYEASTGNTIFCGVERTSSNSVTLLFDAAPQLNQYKVSVFYFPTTITTGGGGGSSRFEYQQTTPSTSWAITHSLNGYPLVSVTDSSGTQIFGDVTYPSSSEVVINFTAAFTGVASLI